MKYSINIRRDGAIKTIFHDRARGIRRAVWFDGKRTYRSAWAGEEGWGEAQLIFRAPGTPAMTRTLYKETTPVGEGSHHVAKIRTKWLETSGSGARVKGESDATGAQETSRRSSYLAADGTTRDTVMDEDRSVVTYTSASTDEGDVNAGGTVTSVTTPSPLSPDEGQDPGETVSTFADSTGAVYKENTSTFQTIDGTTTITHTVVTDETGAVVNTVDTVSNSTNNADGSRTVSSTTLFQSGDTVQSTTVYQPDTPAGGYGGSQTSTTVVDEGGNVVKENVTGQDATGVQSTTEVNHLDNGNSTITTITTGPDGKGHLHVDVIDPDGNPMPNTGEDKDIDKNAPGGGASGNTPQQGDGTTGNTSGNDPSNPSGTGDDPSNPSGGDDPSNPHGGGPGDTGTAMGNPDDGTDETPHMPTHFVGRAIGDLSHLGDTGGGDDDPERRPTIQNIGRSLSDAIGLTGGGDSGWGDSGGSEEAPGVPLQAGSIFVTAHVPMPVDGWGDWTNPRAFVGVIGSATRAALVRGGKGVSSRTLLRSLNVQATLQAAGRRQGVL